MSAQPIAITGLGAVSCFGFGVGSLWSAIEEGRDGIRPLQRFPTAPFAATHAALVPEHDRPKDIEKGRTWPRELCIELAAYAIREAAEDAGIGRALTSSRTALVLGTCMGDQVFGMETLTSGVALALGLAGPCLTVSTACASSATALATARDLLDLDAADVVIAAGADVLTLELFAGFAVLGLLSPTKCAPFSTPFGISLGEGAGALVLERASDATARRVRIRAWLAGYGLTSDGHHPTSPAPDGSGVRRALEAAAIDSGVAANEIGYVNAHGTGTESNDASEWQGIKRALGREDVPVSSSKSYFGHAQGAAAALEVITTILAMERQVVPPTLRWVGPRLRTPLDPIAGDRPRAHRYQAAASVSSAFGGSNVALILARDTTRRAARGRPVFLRGMGWLGPEGSELIDFAAGRVPSGRARAFRVEDHARRIDPRTLDRASRLLTWSSGAALGGLAISGAARDRAGLFVGQRCVSAESARELQQSFEERGPAGLSATAFSRVTLNAPTGACARSLSLRGPTSTLSAGGMTGLLALIHASQLIATRDDVDLIVAAALDEEWRESYEGAVSALLSCEEEDGSWRIAGWGLASPCSRSSAMERAMSVAGVRQRDLQRLELTEIATATRALCLLLGASCGSAGSILLEAVDPSFVSVAVVLTREGSRHA